MKPFQELDLMNRFLFDNVMEDEETCRDILSICLGREIPTIVKAQKEKTCEVSDWLRAARLDIFSLDENDTAYNAEAQQKNTYNLPKRMRFYQAHLDVSLLKPGEDDFNQLNDSFMVMIMPFDLFGKGRYRYTFENYCIEEPGLRLNDHAVKVFLNTRGTNDDEVDDELIEFLRYMENSKTLSGEAGCSERLRRIHRQVSLVKANQELGVKYMREWEEKKEIRDEGRQEGRTEGMLLGKASNLVESVDNVMKSFNLDVQKACEVLGSSVEQYQSARELLAKQEE